MIGIEGSIGVGKSTFSEKLAEELVAELFLEPVKENEWLPRFYSDPPKFGYKMQKYCFDNRMLMHQKAEENNGYSILDRTMFGDWAFELTNYKCKNISEREHTAYSLNRDVTFESQRPLDLILFLKAPTNKCLERIKKRGRKCEQGITIEYLTTLDESYSEILEWVRINQPKTRVVVVEWTDDFAANTKRAIELVKEHFIDDGEESNLTSSSGGNSDVETFSE